MKVQLFKKGRVVLPIFLVMVLVTAGVIGISSGANAAAKSTTYTVTLASGSENLSQTSQDKGGAMEVTGTLSGSFKMIVDAKGKVVIPKKTFKWTQTLGGIAQGYVSTMLLKKDAKGKLGSGGDVVASLNAKKMTVKTGKDTKVPGALAIVLSLDCVTIGPPQGGESGKVVNKSVYTYTYTTGTATITAKGTKNGFDGKSLTGKGEVLNLDAGTGKMVGVTGFMNAKSSDPAWKLIDNLGFSTIVLQISK